MNTTTQQPQTRDREAAKRPTVPPPQEDDDDYLWYEMIDREKQRLYEMGLLFPEDI
jgi:hypothetical protein